MTYRYTLDSTSKKYACPQCSKKTMVAYIDTTTGQPVDIYEFGRCDREAKCNYHASPYDDPELRKLAKTENFTPPVEPVVVQIFPEETIWKPIVERTKSAVSPFHQWAGKLTVPADHLLRCGVYSEDELTVFIFRNQAGQICNLKWFKYKADGHRDKDFNAYSLKNPSPHPTNQKKPEKISGEKEGSGDLKKYRMCLFMEHLLDPEKKKTVCVVESEKTAALASFFYPAFDWVACGSASGLSDGTNGTPDKVTPLKGRKVIWLTDADKAGRGQFDKEGKWRFPSSVRNLIASVDDFSIFDLFRERIDGYDIGDAIADGMRPIIEDPEAWVKGRDSNKPLITKDQQMGYLYELPEGVVWEKVKDDIFKYMQFEHAGKVWIVRKRKGDNDVPYYCQDITNFTIKALGLIASETEPARLVEIKNIHNFSQVVKVPTSAFASPTEFTVFMESVGNFQYDGIGTDLKRVRAKLYDTMLTFEEIDTLGWHHTGYFLFANGAYNGKFTPIDKYGFVKLGERNFFIQPLSIIHKEESESWGDEKKFIYKPRKDVGLKDWAALFCTVHKDNGRIALAWYITSLFRDFIYLRFKFFPHCFLFGPRGTGKSQVGWSIRATGYVGLVKPFNLNSGTDVSFYREFSHFKNFPGWFDEYANSIQFTRIQGLKSAYDGVGHKRSIKDSANRTQSTEVNRAALISGQEMPVADNALFTRNILLSFTQNEFSEEERATYRKLQQWEEGGLTHITAGFMHFRKDIEESYLDEFEMVMDDVMNTATAMKFDVEDRIARNNAIILTTIKVLEKKIGDRLPYTYEDLKKVIMDNMRHQMSLISKSNETNTFWDTVEFLALKGEIKEGEDFVFDEKKIVKVCVDRDVVEKHLDKTTPLVYVRFNKIIPLYREAFKRQNNSTASPLDKGSLMHYLQNSKPYIGMVKQVQFKNSRTSAYCFDYELLNGFGISLNSNSDGATPPPPVEPWQKGGSNDLPF